MSGIWFKIDNTVPVVTPALMLFPERIENNIRKMIAIAGGVERLRPHVKTHKLPELIRLQIRHGITKFKCATIAEAEMTAMNGGKDILIAFPLTGTAIDRFINLVNVFPSAEFSLIADSAYVISELSHKAVESGIELHVLLDLDIGMHRTGIIPGPEALKLYQLINDLPGLILSGLHVYDGHIRDSNLTDRAKVCNRDFKKATDFIGELNKAGFTTPLVIAGGTPTFPVHAKASDLELSPGTCILWDYGYSTAFPDLTFKHAAVLMTTIVSKPAENLLCLDLGHKAIASEMSQPRVFFPEIKDFEVINHSEEHMVIAVKNAEMWEAGQYVYGIPVHICPTMALHENVYVVKNGSIVDEWKVLARKRKITV